MYVHVCKYKCTYILSEVHVVQYSVLYCTSTCQRLYLYLLYLFCPLLCSSPVPFLSPLSLSCPSPLFLSSPLLCPYSVPSTVPTVSILFPPLSLFCPFLLSLSHPLLCPPLSTDLGICH